MMAFKDRIRQIIKLPLTRLAVIALALWISVMKSALGDLHRPTGRAVYALRPTHFTHDLIALGIVNEILNMDQHTAPTNKDLGLFYINLLETN